MSTLQSRRNGRVADVRRVYRSQNVQVTEGFPPLPWPRHSNVMRPYWARSRSASTCASDVQPVSAMVMSSSAIR